MAGPKISDFSHLFGDDSRVGKLMTIDLERGIFHADTPEEGRTMAEIVFAMAAARRAGHTQVDFGARGNVDGGHENLQWVLKKDV